MTDEPLRFCQFGAGRIGQIHAANLAVHPDAELVSVADAAEALAANQGARVTTPDDALADDTVDAVIIASSTDTHADLIEASARAGKAIFCEKPIDLDIKRVDACLAVVAECDVPLFVGFNRRFDPSFAALKARLDDGEIGPVEMVSITSRDPGPPPLAYLKVSGGLFRDMMIHDLDMARWLLSEEPVQVFAFVEALVDPAVATVGDVDTAVVVLRTASGRLAQISNSRRAVYGYDQRVEVLGGTGDPHLQAAEEGLTMEYKSPVFDQLHPWAQNQAKDANMKTVGIYAGALGFGYNTELLKSKNLPVPKCWKDLANPAFKGEIQVANPNSSGTSYTTLATLVQVFGEKEAFEFYAKMHKNINQYTKSGSAPIKAAARGETTIGITFMHDMVTQKVKGFPIEIVAPCEGTGYEIGSMSIIKGGRNPESAKKFYDFALDAAIQMRAKEAKAYQVPSNMNANPPKEAPDLSALKLINYDFKKYGSSAERKRLLAKWDKEIKTLPR